MWDGQGHNVGVGWTGAQCRCGMDRGTMYLCDGQGHNVDVGWTGAQCRCGMDRGTL